MFEMLKELYLKDREMQKAKFDKYFCGQEISPYGREKGRVDYAALSRAVGACVLCNDISRLFGATINGKYQDAELLNGCEYDDDENDNGFEIFQYYIIDERGAAILQEYTDELVYFLPLLNLYVWGVTHWGTSWDYVLTDIPCEKEDAITPADEGGIKEEV